jgi:hypothetical protein
VIDRRRHVALYGRLAALYPRSFRDDYHADLVVLFAEQLGDEPPGRVWLRALRDLAVTVPLQHVEAHMTNAPPHLVTVASGVVAGTAALLGVTVGTPAMPALAFVALFAAITAYWSWQANRSAHGLNAPKGLWWKLLIAAPTLAALTFAAMAIPWPDAVDLGGNGYWLALVTLMASLTMGVMGLFLRIAAPVVPVLAGANEQQAAGGSGGTSPSSPMRSDAADRREWHPPARKRRRRLSAAVVLCALVVLADIVAVNVVGEMPHAWWFLAVPVGLFLVPAIGIVCLVALLTDRQRA